MLFLVTLLFITIIIVKGYLMPLFLPSLAIGALVGVAGYLLLTFQLFSLDASIAFLAGALITALIVSFVANNNNETSEDHDNADGDGDVATLYVGNLPYRVNEQAVKDYFDNVTQVQSVRLLRDRKTGKRKGFGFVEVPEKDVDKVIKKLNDSEFEDRTLKVRVAKDRNERDDS